MRILALGSGWPPRAMPNARDNYRCRPHESANQQLTLFIKVSYCCHYARPRFSQFFSRALGSARVVGRQRRRGRARSTVRGAATAEAARRALAFSVDSNSQAPSLAHSTVQLSCRTRAVFPPVLVPILLSVHLSLYPCRSCSCRPQGVASSNTFFLTHSECSSQASTNHLLPAREEDS